MRSHPLPSRGGVLALQASFGRARGGVCNFFDASDSLPCAPRSSMRSHPLPLSSRGSCGGQSAAIPSLQGEGLGVGSVTFSQPQIRGNFFAETSSLKLLRRNFFADRILQTLQTPPLAPPLEGRGVPHGVPAAVKVITFSQIVFLVFIGFYCFFLRPLCGTNTHR